MKSKKLFGLLFLFVCFAFATTKYTLIKKIPLSASRLTSDNLGNIYLTRGNVLEKYDNIGNLLKSYSNNTLGSINFVDVTNPLNIILFYKDFPQIVLLDNTLSAITGSIPLEHYGLENASLVCSSFNNGMWFYNQNNFELLRCDAQFKTTHRTGNIVQVTGQNIKPIFLTEYDNKVYLSDPNSGILVFDIYGTYYKTLPLKDINTFQVNGSDIVYFYNSYLHSYNLKTLEQQVIQAPDTVATNIRIESKKMFVQKDNSVDIYSVTDK